MRKRKGKIVEENGQKLIVDSWGRKSRQKKSLRQVLVARNMVLANGQKSAQQILLDSGYSPTTAGHMARQIIESPGVQEALNSFGFDEKNAKRVVGEILSDHRKRAVDRLNAADKVFKVFGTYAPEKRVEIQARIDVKDERLEEIRKEYENRMERELLHRTP